MMTIRKLVIAVLVLILTPLSHVKASSSRDELPDYLRDRGTGVPSSMFGTYIEKQQLLVYLYYEYYYDTDMEYEPADFGYGISREHTGKYTAHEGLIFLGYGITDRLAIELEMAVISARLEKDENDSSEMPDFLEESGLDDVESQRVVIKLNCGFGLTPKATDLAPEAGVMFVF